MKTRIMPAATIVVLVALAGGELVLHYTRDRSRRLQATTSAKTLADSLWQAPDSISIAGAPDADLVRYGQDLIVHTGYYFGPAGTIARRQNGMDCQNCHLQAGRQPWGNNFGGVASTYPKFRERRGAVESIAQRITDCFHRSLNGEAPDSTSREVRAMIAYMQWLGAGVPKGKKPAGSGIAVLPFMDRAADPEKGKRTYDLKCSRCHGPNGEGVKDNNGRAYIYPPLWGDNSYNTAAGFFRIARLAGFIRYNMPFGTDYRKMELSPTEAWDLSAFINSQPRPVKDFPEDWPDISLKPVDYPFGPFVDSFPAQAHKFGPFLPIERAHQHH
jgi:thiosulfate dehydrogenase